jgi:hypothetical protein
LDIPIYFPSPAAGTCLYSGEIVSDLVRFRLDVGKMAEAEPSIEKIVYPYAVVLSQACDLAQDFTARRQNRPQVLPDVFFCHLPIAEELKFPRGELNSKLWDRVHKNKDERYHFLQKIPVECDAQGKGLPELCVDFKRYFSMPTDEVYRRLELGPTARRAFLGSPYLEHLSNRFSYFLGRVALPHDHVSE